MNLTAAASQKAEDRPISFVLDNKGSPVTELKLFIRPEDLQITSPSRTSVNQTLGGAFVDSFGEGLQSVTMTGITGWRTGPDGKDGVARLIDLKSKIFTQWHELREKAIAAGTDPNDVKLRYVDCLNKYYKVITPQVFEIRRSKSRPLLGSFRFSFVAVDNAKEPAASSADSALASAKNETGIAGLIATVKKITEQIKTVKEYIDKNILGPVKDFMSLTKRVLTAVQDMISAGVSVVGSIINVARTVTQAGVNIFRTLAAVASIPQTAKAALMQIAGQFSNAFCLLSNALKVLPRYEDYQTLYGASNCSSTAGGRPASVYADTNPFYAIKPTPSAQVSVSPEAAKSLTTLTNSDVVLAPMTQAQIGAACQTVVAGVKV